MWYTHLTILIPIFLAVTAAAFGLLNLIFVPRTTCAADKTNCLKAIANELAMERSKSAEETEKVMIKDKEELDFFKQEMCKKMDKLSQQMITGFGNIDLSMRNLATDLKSEISLVNEKREESRMLITQHIGVTAVKIENINNKINSIEEELKNG